MTREALTIALALAVPFLVPGSLDAASAPPYQGARVFALTMAGTDFNLGVDPDGPRLEAVVGETLVFIVHVPAYAEPHTFHLHNHPWQDFPDGRLIDTKLIFPGETHTFTVSAGLGEFTGDFLFHCHMESHFAAGMWGILRVHPMGTPLPTSPDVSSQGSPPAPPGVHGAHGISHANAQPFA